MERKNQSRRYRIRLITLLFVILLSGCASNSVEEISLKSLSQLPSQHPIVVVNFWATWCGPCLIEIPLLNRVHTARPDVHIYGISVDDAALGTEVAKFVDKYKIAYPVYMKERSENKESQQWYENVDAIPITYIFKDGKLHHTILGGIEKESELTDAIEGPSEEEQFAGTDEEDSDEEDEESFAEEEE